MQLTKDRYFYKSAISIAAPIALQNVITFSVSMADTIMIGKLGEVNLSASAIGNHLFFIFMVLMFGVGSGASVMASQYYGKKDIESIHKIISIMYRICILLSILFALIALLFPKLFMSIFTKDEAVIIEGVKYLRMVGISYIFYSIAGSTITILRAVKTVKISLVVYFISLIVNIFLNWVLIFGNLGIEPMGIRGAAIATLASRITELLVVIIFMTFFEKKIKLKIKYLLTTNKTMVKDFTRVSTPIILNELFWVIGASMISVILGRMGREVVAANSINNVTHQFSTLFIFGLSSASSVIIGNTIGKGEYEKAKEYANTICILSIAMGIIAGITIFFLRNVVVNFYNVSPLTKQIAKDIMIATSVIAVFKSVTSNVMMGVLRGGGDNKFVFKMEIIFMWMISIPFGFIGAFVWNLPITVVFLIIRSDEIFKAFAGVIRIRKDKWIKNVTRE